MSDREHHGDPLAPLRELDGPAADPQFADRVEAGLRAAHASAETPWVAPWRRVVVLAPALAMLVVIATTTVLLRDDTPSAALELTDARGVIITLPDGTTVVDPSDGFALVDGATVVVGADGTATIDEVTLGSGTTVTVRDGTLVTDVVGTTTSTTPVGDVAAGAEPTPTRTPTASTDPPRSSTSIPPVSTTTSAVPASSRPSQPDDGPVDVRPATSTAPPPEAGPPPDDSAVRPAEPAPTQPAPTDGVDLALRLRVRARGGDVLITWRTDGAEGLPWRTVVLRRVGDGAPGWPAADGTAVLAETEGSRPGELIDERVPDAAVHYRIVVLDPDDGVVAQSAVQTLAHR